LIKVGGLDSSLRVTVVMIRSVRSVTSGLDDIDVDLRGFGTRWIITPEMGFEDMHRVQRSKADFGDPEKLSFEVVLCNRQWGAIRILDVGNRHRVNRERGRRRVPLKRWLKMPGCWHRWDYRGRSSAWFRVGLDGGVLLLQLVLRDVVPHGVMLKFFTDDFGVFSLG